MIAIAMCVAAVAADAAQCEGLTQKGERCKREAYYYADIPADQYQELDPDGAYQTSVPKWVFYVLFFAWGWLMWRLWCRISRKD